MNATAEATAATDNGEVVDVELTELEGDYNILSPVPITNDSLPARLAQVNTMIRKLIGLDETELQQKLAEVREFVANFKIESDDDLEIANDARQKIKGIIAGTKTQCEPVVTILHKSHRASTEYQGQYVKPFEDADTTIKRAMDKFVTARENERIRKEQEAQAAAAKAAREEQARLDALAAKAKAAGDKEQAEVLAQQAATVQPVPVQTAPPPKKVEGMAAKKVVIIDSIDKAKFVASVAADPTRYLGCIEVKESAVKAILTASGGTAVIPGVTYHNGFATSTRGK